MLQPNTQLIMASTEFYGLYGSIHSIWSKYHTLWKKCILKCLYHTIVTNSQIRNAPRVASSWLSWISMLITWTGLLSKLWIVSKSNKNIYI